MVSLQKKPPPFFAPLELSKVPSKVYLASLSNFGHLHNFVSKKTVWWDLDRFNAFFCITNLMSKMAIRPPPSVNLPYLFRWAQIDSSLLSGRIDLWLSFQFASHPIKKILGSKSNYLLIWQIELAYQAKPRNPRKIEKQWWNGKLNKK